MPNAKIKIGVEAMIDRKITAKKEKDSIISLLGDQVVAYRPYLVSILGNVNAALFLTQILYWHEKSGDRNGWIYKTKKELMRETGLTFRMQDNARNKLKKEGILEEKLAGIPRKLFYRLKTKNLMDLITKNNEINTALNFGTIVSEPLETKIPVKETNKNNIKDISSHLYIPKSNGSSSQNVVSITENTQQNTQRLSLLPETQDTERELFSYSSQDIVNINDKIKSVFQVKDSTISKIKIQKLDYLLYLIEKNCLRPENISHLYAYSKNLTITEEFPNYRERHRPKVMNDDFDSHSQENGVITCLQQRFPRVDVCGEIDRIRSQKIAYPDNPDDLMSFLTTMMAAAQQRNDESARTGLENFRKILYSQTSPRRAFKGP